MRVALDARLLGYQEAGTATYIRGILSGMREMTHPPDLVVIASRKGRRIELLSSWPHSVAWTPCHHRFERWTLGLELVPLGVDVVHSPDFIPPHRFVGRWARVITVHDLAFLRWPELVTADSRRYYGQIFDAVRVADRIICVSDSTRHDLLDLVSSSIDDRIKVIPEGVDQAFAPADRATAAGLVRDRFNLEKPFFLFVGTVEPRKNLPRLIRAFGHYLTRRGDLGMELVVAGARGWLDDDVISAAHDVGGSVRLVGNVTRDELVSLYNAALALVLVSLFEGFGLPVVEAMACGVPTIVSSVGSLPEIVGDAGILVDPRDEDAISNALERIVDDLSLRSDLAERGIRQAARFRWKTVAETTARVYEQAAACAS